MRKFGVGSGFLAALVLAATSAWGQQDDAADSPDPDLEPSEVVQIQLEALKHNDDPFPDAGIALVFNFASPSNRTQTGPLPRFADMIHNGFGEMLNYREAHLLPMAVRDGMALQPVELVGRDGAIHRYVFVLARQTEPPYRGCWMTDSVIGDPNGSPADEPDRSI
jgi:hypothetical protein